ncbi:MAG: winged helix DNA-binding domain-containing protein, partial [Litoreibacter sp.]|nr:winged helix DNA-binding domain-containing protein [Litoreibacter sp.]
MAERRISRENADQGACCSADVGADEKRSSGGWWDWHPSKTALEYLWRTGALSVCHRRGFRKYYDLTENVIPPEYLNARTYLEETVDWACNAALDRLGFATSGELANFWDLTTKEEAKTWCARGVADQSLIEIEVEGADGR